MWAKSNVGINSTFKYVGPIIESGTVEVSTESVLDPLDLI